MASNSIVGNVRGVNESASRHYFLKQEGDQLRSPFLLYIGEVLCLEVKI